MSEDIISEDKGFKRFVEALGLAALDLWSELPHGVQHELFEQAVLRGHRTERDESLREQLAAFLHDRHQRTAGRDGPFPADSPPVAGEG